VRINSLFTLIGFQNLTNRGEELIDLIGHSLTWQRNGLAGQDHPVRNATVHAKLWAIPTADGRNTFEEQFTNVTDYYVACEGQSW
jgi:hypothetical protein